jgi:hypothetical protein
LSEVGLLYDLQRLGYKYYHVPCIALQIVKYINPNGTRETVAKMNPIQQTNKRKRGGEKRKEIRRVGIKSVNCPGPLNPGDKKKSWILDREKNCGHGFLHSRS